MSLADQFKLEEQTQSFELKITSMTSTSDGVQVNAGPSKLAVTAPALATQSARAVPDGW